MELTTSATDSIKVLSRIVELRFMLFLRIVEKSSAPILPLLWGMRAELFIYLEKAYDYAIF
jgi:hypothetical protein